MTDPWNEILARITANRPSLLDNEISGGFEAALLGKVVLPEASWGPSSAVWKCDTTEYTYIGIRIRKPPKSPEKVARHLAAAALERSVVPIILSSVDFSGFEQFGFRVERIPEEAAAAASAEEEIRKFWNLALIIEENDVVQLK